MKGSKADDKVKFNKETFITRTPGSITDKWTKVKDLGSGSYGKVYRVQNKITKEMRACKELSKKKIADLDKFNLEISIMSKCDHPSIIKLYEIYEDKRHIYLIMEECLGGELFDRILSRIDSGQMYSEKQAAIIFKQLMSAISYCHSQGICHRDLKPENILFLSKDENSPIKVIDFGLSKIFGEIAPIQHDKKQKKRDMNTRVGTAYYVSPEVLNGQYDEKCDIWSAGVILYILLCGDPPFNGENDNEIYRAIAKKKYSFPDNEWKNISKEAKDLISHMLCDPDKRYTAQKVLEHNWVVKEAPNAKSKIENLNINTLKKYIGEHKLKKAVLTYIASRLGDDEVKNLKEIFQSLDANKDGTLTFDEVKNGMEKLKNKGIDMDLENLFKSIDTDNSGRIDYTEFLAASIDQKEFLRQERLNEAFMMLDKKGTGKISKEELKKALKLDNVSDSTLDQYIKKYDLNNDGTIDYNEFLNMMGEIK
jgi:calcium-dependent protein kinase